MTETTKIFITAITTALLTNVNNLYQFIRSNKFLFRNRNKYLYKLIKESIDALDHELESIERFVARINADPHKIRLYDMPSYAAIDFLATKLMTDDYYFAYVRMFSYRLDSEDKYLLLQSNVVFVNEQIKQVREMAGDALKRDNERRKTALQTFKNSTENLNIGTLRSMGANSFEMHAINKLISDFYKKLRIAGTQSADISEINDEVVVPILGITTQNQKVFSALNDELKIFVSQYGEIAFQNRAISSEFKEIAKVLVNPLQSLKDIRYYWNSYFRFYIT